MAAVRTFQSYTCPDCGRVHRNYTHNRVCPSCLHERRKHPCSDCGTRIDGRSMRCNTCRGAMDTGSQSPNWKGGRTVHKASGYVLIKMPSHPNARADGYVREHTLVMANAIGRPIAPDEVVHHRNHDRADNRLENLQLMSRDEHSRMHMLERHASGDFARSN